MKKCVLIIGAGIAGLSAAYRLHKAGLCVAVFEACGRVGGRMSSDNIDGYIFDRGAQFLSRSYTSLLPLIEEVGLGHELKAISVPASAVLLDGKLRRLRADNPFTMLASGLLPLGEWLKSGAFLLRAGAKLRNLPLDDYAAFADFDDEDAAEWLKAEVGEHVLEYLFEPALEGLYFQQPEGTSKALAMWLMGYSVRRGALLTLKSGLGALPEALAAPLDVRLNTSIVHLCVTSKGVEARTVDGQTFRADYAVLATTAPIAKKIYTQAPLWAESLLSTRYSATINLGLGARSNWNDQAALKGVYGLLIPRRERKHIAAIAIESHKLPNRAPHGELLDVMLAGEAGARLIGASDAEITKMVVTESEPHFPGLQDEIWFSHVVRWEYAEPLSPIGRSRAIRTYRQKWTHDQRVILAGDYMATPTTDGAVHSGLWAAKSIQNADC